MFKCSSVQVFKCSGVQVFKYSGAKRSEVPQLRDSGTVQCVNVLMCKYANEIFVRRSL